MLGRLADLVERRAEPRDRRDVADRLEDLAAHFGEVREVRERLADAARDRGRLRAVELERFEPAELWRRS